MASVYGRLGFNSSNPIANSVVQPLDTDLTTQMKFIPPWLNDWQKKDVAEANTAGYFQNPMIDTLANVQIVANTMMRMANGHSITGSTNTITTLLANTKHNSRSIGYSNTESQIVSEVDDFTYLTDRISNVVEHDGNMTVPHYQTATGYGTLLTYITNQTDGIQNNSPMIGCFTSLYTQNTLDSAVINTSSLLVTLNNSITSQTTGTPPNTITTYSSNISLSDAQSLDTNMAAIFNTMNSCRNNDISFYQNSQAVVNDYNKVAIFRNLGQTENQLIQERIGSPKLLSRLNANTANN